MLLLSLLLAFEDAGKEGRLAERLRKREPEAMAELYDRYSRLAFSLILRIVSDQGTAEDLLQETFLRVWNRAHSFDAERGALGPWVMAVARNRAIDHLRSASGRQSQVNFDLERLEVPGLFADLEDELLNSDRARRLRAAIQKLDANQKQVIELAYFEGLSQSEMAERLQRPLGTIKTWVRNALQILRDELTEVAAT